MILKSEEATIAAGAALAPIVRAGKVITLSGPLGVGKTALARGLIMALGHEGEVPSPSFAIVQPYDELDPPVLHVDLYRIEEPSEIDELGLDAAVAAFRLELVLDVAVGREEDQHVTVRSGLSHAAAMLNERREQHRACPQPSQQVAS